MIFKRTLKKFGQILRKMAFTDFSKYKMLKTTSFINHIEPEKEIIYESSQSSSNSHVSSSEFSSAYISPESSFQMNKKKSLDVCLSRRDQFDSFDLSNIRVKVPPNDPWAASVTKDDQSSLWNSSSTFSSFASVKENLAPTEFHTNTSTTFFNDFTYAPLSNYNDTFYDESIWKGYYNSNDQMQQECIRHDFEMNGKTVDMSNAFEPSAVSTPLVDRKNHQHDYLANGQFSYSQYDHYDQMQENINAGFEISCQNFYNPSSNNEIAAVPFNYNNNNNQSRERSRKLKSNRKPVLSYCVFCKNNKAHPEIYNSHSVRDSRGICTCPVLRQYKCPICNLDGDAAHTTKYCPMRKVFTEEDMRKADLKSKFRGLKF